MRNLSLIVPLVLGACSDPTSSSPRPPSDVTEPAAPPPVVAPPPPRSVDPPEREAAAVDVAACENGEHRACANLLAVASARSDHMEALKWAALGCEREAPPGNLSMCEAAGSAAFRIPDHETALRWYGVACNQGHTGACRSAALSVQRLGRPNDAFPWLEKACGVGDNSACAEYRAARAATPDAPDLLALQKSCRERKDIAACVRAASVLEHGGRSADALAWWQAACDHGAGSACLEVGKRGPPAQPPSSSPAYRRACDLGERQACVGLGFMAENEDLKDESAAWFAKACALGDAFSCSRGGGANPAVIEATLRQKCVDKDGNACISLSKLSGEGTEQRLRWLEDTCANANGFACFARGLATARDKPEDAGAWMKKACAHEVKDACFFVHGGR